MAFVGQENELLFAGKSTMHDGIAVIGGHYHHFIVGQHLFELTYLGQTARPFGDVSQPMQFTGRSLLEGTPVFHGIVVVIVLATLILLSVRPRRHQGPSTSETVLVVDVDATESVSIMGTFTYLGRYDQETRTLPPPEPVEFRAMNCNGVTKEMLLLPVAIKVHPAMDYLMALLKEADIVPDDDIMKRPVLKLHGDCQKCQKLLNVCSTPRDVGLSKTEVMYLMMPMEWSEPVKWDEMVRA